MGFRVVGYGVGSGGCVGVVMLGVRFVYVLYTYVHVCHFFFSIEGRAKNEGCEICTFSDTHLSLSLSPPFSPSPSMLPIRRVKIQRANIYRILDTQ